MQGKSEGKREGLNTLVSALDESVFKERLALFFVLENGVPVDLKRKAILVKRTALLVDLERELRGSGSGVGHGSIVMESDERNKLF